MDGRIQLSNILQKPSTRVTQWQPHNHVEKNVVSVKWQYDCACTQCISLPNSAPWPFRRLSRYAGAVHIPQGQGLRCVSEAEGLSSRCERRTHMTNSLPDQMHHG